MENLNIALLQLAPGRNLEENLEIGLAACRKAGDLGADIALFPEVWSSGYRLDPQLSIPQDHPFLAAFGRTARELGMAVGITCLESCPTGPKNSFFLFDRFGNLALRYAKVHTCDFGDEAILTPGEGFSVATLDTAKGPVEVGAMICYDREFPESARILMLQGAELILVPNACPMEINRLSQLRARAYENMVAIATCNYPAGHPDCNGRSTVFDGVAYLPDLEGSRDCCILEAPEAAGIYLVQLDLPQLRTYRESEVHGNAYRHPQKYGALVEPTIRPPFLRPDYRP